MIIREELLVEHSKSNTQRITSYIGTNSTRLKELMDCFFCNEYRVSQRSAMAVSHYFDQHPHMMDNYLEEMILNLDKPDLHVAIKRNTVRILQFIKIPENLQASLFDRCLTYIIDLKEPVAVKAFSMTILYNLCKNYPELKTEVIPVLEELLQRSESIGVLNRGKKILKLLHKL